MASRKYAFLVSLWLEPETPTHGAAWRGSVEHLSTRERRYFSGVAEMVAFLAAHVHAPRDGSDADD